MYMGAVRVIHHFLAAVGANLTICVSEEVTMRIGGWSNIYTMRKIYTKISDKDINDQAARLQAFFSNENARSDNENANKKA